ncbi:MAG: hypothetical protein P8K80_03955 [Phycisphaerales bacterium]|nr:hypothetical protein [Phycisphaerales bacterium]
MSNCREDSVFQRYTGAMVGAMEDCLRRTPRAMVLCASMALLLACLGCETTVKDPMAALADKSAHDRTHFKSMEIMQQRDPANNEAYKDQLEQIVWRPGYGFNVRVEALNQLWEYDQPRTLVLLRRQLPRMTNWPWLTECCTWIADRNLVELDPALISSWGRPRALTQDETERPEYIALVRMHGRDAVVEKVFELFIESNKRSQRGLRQRCWDLLHRLGERDRLIAMAEAVEPDSEDILLMDLNASATDFGMVPYNREEVIWLQELRQPDKKWFWDEAKVSLQQVPANRRGELEMRDLSVVVAATRHRRDLLDAPVTRLYTNVDGALRGQKHYSEYHPGIPGADASLERLRTHREKLTWSDLAAIELALQALRLAPVRAHLFAYADEDHEDESTEYGGVIALDEQGRFEVLEFKPRIRHHDLKFNASQDMFDAGYTSLFHFHFHAQSHGNRDHAGPGLGDMNYADNTRANCLVFTFVDEDRMNVDYYRHDRVIVDLGTIQRPGSN